MGLLDGIRFVRWAYALSKLRRAAPECWLVRQQARLRELLRLAVDRAPFYRAKYRGIDVSRCRLTDLPPTSKSELMAHFDEAVTDPEIRRADLEAFLDDPGNVGRWFLGRYAVSHTSGSQGQPMMIVQPRRLLELFFALQLTRGNATTRVTVPEAFRRLFNRGRLAVVTMKNGFYPSASTFSYMPPIVSAYTKVLRLSQTDPDLIEKLNAFRPQALTGYASVLDRLAAEAEAGRLRLAPDLKQLVNNSEMLTEAARARIEAAFGVHVMNNYATGECTFLSIGCRKDVGAHVNADWVIFEVVDEQYRPVPPGTPGQKVLITNLGNTVQPFIRYEVGDVVVMATTPCRCDSTMPRIERIEGRTSDKFWVRDGSAYRPVPSSVFKQAFDYLREVREWQAVQEKRNSVTLRVELLPGAVLDETRAWSIIHRQLDLYDLRGLLQLRLETVPRLVADPATGKFRRMVSLVGAPSDLPSAENGNAPATLKTPAAVTSAAVTSKAG
jgi:phenylacetate-coenzyme A ligase PaaK-like adenylate-forming protein